MVLFPLEPMIPRYFKVGVREWKKFVFAPNYTISIHKSKFKFWKKNKSKRHFIDFLSLTIRKWDSFESKLRGNVSYKRLHLLRSPLYQPTVGNISISILYLMIRFLHKTHVHDGNMACPFHILAVCKHQNLEHISSICNMEYIYCSYHLCCFSYITFTYHSHDGVFNSWLYTHTIDGPKQLEHQ